MVCPYHNQPADSPLHRWLSQMWDTVRTETGGRFDVRVCPQNDGIPGGDPSALEMLLAGAIEFYTLPRATFENGFRQISTMTRPIRSADDLVGLRIRTPAGRLFIDFFETLSAQPTAINLNQLYTALHDGAGQEHGVGPTSGSPRRCP